MTGLHAHHICHWTGPQCQETLQCPALLKNGQLHKVPEVSGSHHSSTLEPLPNMSKCPWSSRSNLNSFERFMKLSLKSPSASKPGLLAPHKHISVNLHSSFPSLHKKDWDAASDKNSVVQTHQPSQKQKGRALQIKCILSPQNKV